MLEWGHGVDFLYQAFFELRIFDHFFLGKALDSIENWRVGGFGSEKDMPKASFTDFSNTVELFVVQDSTRL